MRLSRDKCVREVSDAAKQRQMQMWLTNQICMYTIQEVFGDKGVAAFAGGFVAFFVCPFDGRKGV